MKELETVLAASSGPVACEARRQLDSIAGAYEPTAMSMQDVRQVDDDDIEDVLLACEAVGDQRLTHELSREYSLRHDLHALNEAFSGVAWDLVDTWNRLGPGEIVERWVELGKRHAAWRVEAQLAHRPFSLGEWRLEVEPLARTLPLAVLRDDQLASIGRVLAEVSIDMHEEIDAERIRLREQFDAAVASLPAKGVGAAGTARLRELERVFERRGDSPILHFVRREIADREGRGLEL